MRKIFDAMTVISFTVVLAAGAGAGYLYANKDGLIERTKAQVTQQITEAVTGAIGGAMMGGGLTGGAITDQPTVPSVPGVPF